MSVAPGHCAAVARGLRASINLEAPQVRYSITQQNDQPAIYAIYFIEQDPGYLFEFYEWDWIRNSIVPVRPTVQQFHITQSVKLHDSTSRKARHISLLYRYTCLTAPRDINVDWAA